MTAYIFRASQNFLYKGPQKSIIAMVFIDETAKIRLTEAIEVASQNPIVAALMTRPNWREKKLIEIERKRITDKLLVDNTTF